MAYRAQRPIIAYQQFQQQRRLPRNTQYRNKIFAVLTATTLYTVFLYRSGGARSYISGNIMKNALHTGRRLQVATWNIAAINNNPFEYWITYKENPAYEQLMIKIEEFLESPGDKDVQVNAVFTQSMFEKLDQRMTSPSVGWTSVRSYWEEQYSNRPIVSGFMKDDMLGKKRLASMPDRVTNTINTADGKMVFRPTVINMYEEDLSTMDIWWKRWESFMFDTKIKKKGENGKIEEKAPYSMLQKIDRNKYKAVTEQEEIDSLPLQTLCAAIFDAILVHMMNTLESPAVWQELKRTMVQNLNKQKVPHTLTILDDQYSTSDIITLQEVAMSFVAEARKGPLGRKFHIYAPAKFDPSRDQNSVICLNKSKFPRGKEREISDQVYSSFEPGDNDDDKPPALPGDILAITAVSKEGDKYVIASFHGDTNGMATKPVLDAVLKAIASDPTLQSHKLIFGMDANTYEHGVPGEWQDVTDFAHHFVGKGLTSCWGDTPNPQNYTTYNARTYLQPQLNKACRSTEKRSKGDVNPKDFILFAKSAFDVVHTWKDNTGKQQYIEDMAFPTLTFPSDHGILATIIEPITN